MPVFGSFKVGGTIGPLRTWEADYMKRDKDVIEFRNYGTAEKPSGDLVGTANLEKGWTITEVNSTKVPSR